MWKAEPVTLSDEELVVLSAVWRLRRLGACRGRARVILLASQGVSSAEIGKLVPMSEEYVAMWRRRFLERRVAGLVHAPWPGKPVVSPMTSGSRSWR